MAGAIHVWPAATKDTDWRAQTPAMTILVAVTVRRKLYQQAGAGSGRRGQRNDILQSARQRRNPAGFVV
jgi:hypothetical protein